MSFESTAMKQTEFRVGYSDRRFSLSGSAIDQSVVGAIETAKGAWEPHVTRLMSRLIRPDDVCFDIGANVGVYTLIMSDLAAQGRVHAFEPSSSNFAFLQKNMADNHILNASAHHLALGNKTGPGNFHYLPDIAGCSFAEDETVDADADAIIQRAWGRRWTRVTEPVEFATLDLWAAQNAVERLDFIKMDVEGSERFVIEGGKATFEKFKPILFTELNTMCLAKYFGLPPATYFDALKEIYPYIYVILPMGNFIQRLTQYKELERQLNNMRWWADLLCMNRPM